MTLSDFGVTTRVRFWKETKKAQLAIVAIQTKGVDMDSSLTSFVRGMPVLGLQAKFKISFPVLETLVFYLVSRS